MRSHNDMESGELEVRREDIETGFRWSIERTSLDRKIMQEIEFERRNQDAPIHPLSPQGEQVPTGLTSDSPPNFTQNMEEQKHVGANKFDHKEEGQKGVSKDTNKSELVESLKDQIRRLDEQVEFYKEELRDRRTSTKALAEVIQAFRLNAENQSVRQQPNSAKHNDVRGSKNRDEGDNETGKSVTVDVY